MAIVNQMAQAETAASKTRLRFFYKRVERSTRTHGHLWVEAVAETPSGRMHRLLLQDGKPLTASERKAEDDRINSLVQHPDDFRRENQSRKDDEARTADLLRILPKAFLFEESGMEGDCRRINFKPNPAFQEQSYQDRVIHAMSGFMLISKAPENRLCSLEAKIEHQVEFGYGLLGKVSKNSSLSMTRIRVLPGQWKTARLKVHVDANILLLKSVSREEDSMHSDFRQIGPNLSVAEAAKLVNSASYE